MLDTVEGMIALHLVIRQEMEEDDSYERSFPSSLPYIDITTQHYIAEHAKAFTRFTEDCPYSPGVFRVFEEANELRQDMINRLSKPLRQSVPTLDTLRLVRKCISFVVFFVVFFLLSFCCLFCCLWKGERN